MKKAKVTVSMVVGLLVILILAGAALAQPIDYTTYDDTGAIAGSDIDPDYWFAPTEVGTGSLIRNGDFSAWTDGVPDNWTLWADSADGWENAHVAQTNLALTPDGSNDALSFFIRNIGGSGSFYAGAYQHLDGVADGYYWVQTHGTQWGEKLTGYNAVEYYGIGTSEDPSSVTEWRSLDPFTTPCHNNWGLCIYVGRYETVHIPDGSYFHLLAGHKFPVYNAWTVFLFDDISIVPASGDVIEDGYWADGLVGWNPGASR